LEEWETRCEFTLSDIAGEFGQEIPDNLSELAEVLDFGDADYTG